MNHCCDWLLVSSYFSYPSHCGLSYSCAPEASRFVELSSDAAALVLFPKYLSQPLKKQDFSGIIALQFTALKESCISPYPAAAA